MINIIPYPNYCKIQDGVVYFANETNISGYFQNIVELAKSYIINTKLGLNNNIKNTIVFNNKVALNNDEYEIICTNGNCEINSSNERGAFYALMSMVQLKDNKDYFHSVIIKDKPKYKYRGFMLDCARHFWTVDTIKHILNAMASLKLNYFHWHLSDDQGFRAEIKKYPLLTQKGCVRSSTMLAFNGYIRGKEKRELKEYGRGLYYSQEEMKEVVEYAKMLHIDVIPEIDMPGHLVSAISCYPELSCTGDLVEVSNVWGVLDNIACCGKENIYNFAKDIIDELVEIFPCRYFHIGGDEVPKKRWKECKQCQAKIKELNLKDENALQGYFNNEIAVYLKEKNKIVIGWNEILESSLLDKEIVAQWWLSTPKHKNNIYERVNKGGDIILALWEYVYMDHTYSIRNLEKTYSLSIKKVGIKNNQNVLGIEAPQWTEYIRDRKKLYFNTFPRLMAISEVGWTNDDIKNYKNFEVRLENLRSFYENMEIAMPNKFIYSGKIIKRPFRKIKSFKKWYINPYYELEYSEK